MYSEYLLFFPSIKSSPSFIQNLPQTHSPWLSRARPPNLLNEIENALLFLLDSKKTLNLCWLIFLSLHLKITNGKVCFFNLFCVIVSSLEVEIACLVWMPCIVAAWMLNWWIFPVNRFSSKRLLHHTIDWLNFMNNVHTNEVHVC